MARLPFHPSAPLAIAFAALCSACGERGPRCAGDAGLAACGAAPAPTYAELYASVLAPTCGREGPSCHGAGSDSPLSFLDESSSRAYLRDHLVDPGRPGCSELYLRVVSDDSLFRMPPAEPLPEASRCAIARWIEAGAP